MTEEEINKKAEKHCNEVLCNAHEKCNEVIKCRDWRSRRAGFFCGYEQALKDFEKENAELKEQHEVSARNMSSLIESLSKSENEAKKQLTKAKEIIKRYLSIGAGGKITQNYLDVTKEAEQFISEVEK